MSRDFTTDFFLINLLRLIVRACAFFSLGIALFAILAWVICIVYPDINIYFEADVSEETKTEFRLPSINFRDFIENRETSDNGIETTPSLARTSQAFPSRAGQESVKYESAQFLSGDSVLKHTEVDKDKHTRSLPAIGTSSRNKLEQCGLESLDTIRNYSYPNSNNIKDSLSAFFAEVSAPHSPDTTSTKSNVTPSIIGKKQNLELFQRSIIALNELARSLDQLPPDTKEVATFLWQFSSSLPAIEGRDLSTEFLGGFARECQAWRDRLSLGDEDPGLKIALWYRFPTWYSEQFSSILENYLTKEAMTEESTSFESKLNRLIKSPRSLLAIAAASFASYLLCSIVLVFLTVPLLLEQGLSDIFSQIEELRQQEDSSADEHHAWKVE